MSAQDNIDSTNVKTETEKSQNIYRVIKDRDFLVANTTSLKDETLSWKAKGIHLYMLSMKDDWNFSQRELATHATDGKDSLTAGLKELKEAGYVKIISHKENGLIKYWETLVYEVPQLKNKIKYTEEQASAPSVSRSGFPRSGFSRSGKPGHNKDQDQTNIDQNNNKEGGYTKEAVEAPVVVSEDLKKMLHSIGLEDDKFWVKTYGEAKIREKFSFMPPKSKIESSEGAWMRMALQRDYPLPKNVSTVKNGGSSDNIEMIYQKRLENADKQNIEELETKFLNCDEKDKTHILCLIDSLRKEFQNKWGSLIGNELSGAMS